MDEIESYYAYEGRQRLNRIITDYFKKLFFPAFILLLSQAVHRDNYVLFL
jgi:hypothetical protein